LSSEQERLVYLKELRAKLRGVIDGSLDSAAIASYSHSDSDGSQSVSRRDPQSLWKWLNEVEAEITKVERKLSGGGLHCASLRRLPL